MRDCKHAKWFLLFFNRSFYFSTLLALALFGCGGGQSEKTASTAEVPKRPAIPTDPTLILPKECFGAVFIDVAAIRGSKLIDPQSALDNGELTPAQRRLADYLYEHSAAAALCLAKIEEDTRDRADAAAILRGDFDPRTLEALTKESVRSDVSPKDTQPVTKEYRGYQQLFVSNRAQALLLDQHTFVVANRSLIPGVLAAAEGDQSSRFIGSELHRKLNNYAGFSQCALCGAMVLPPNVKNRVNKRSTPSLLRKYTDIVNGITTAGLRVDLKTGIEAAVVLETSSPDHPAVLGEALKGMIMVGKFVYQDSAFTAVADNLTVNAEGLIVRIKTHATLKQATHLIAMLKQQLSNPPGSE